jgi:hypothetical protein
MAAQPVTDTEGYARFTVLRMIRMCPAVKFRMAAFRVLFNMCRSRVNDKYSTLYKSTIKLNAATQHSLATAHADEYDRGTARRDTG